MAEKLNVMKIGFAGALAGAATPYIMKWVVSPILGLIGQYTPIVTAKLANPAIDINVQSSLTGIETGLGPKAVTWLTNALGVTIPANVGTQLLTGAIGGALLFILGAYAADMLGLLSGGAVEKTMATIFAGSIITALILGTIALPVTLGITFVNVLIAFLINAAILAWLFVTIDNKGNLGILPH